MLLSLFYMSIIHATKCGSAPMIFFACLFRRLWCFEMKVEKMEAKGQEQICYSIRSPECKSATLTISGRAAILVGELNA